MLKETPQSLRLYFTLISILSLIPFLLAIAQGRWPEYASVSGVFGLCFTGLLIYIAARFHALLRKPTLILTVLALGAALTVVNHAVRFVRSGVDLISVGGLVLSLLIFWYLFLSITRLSREVAQQSGASIIVNSSVP